VRAGRQPRHRRQRQLRVREGWPDRGRDVRPGRRHRAVCNPTAALLAFGLALDHAGHAALGNALRKAVLDAIADGKSTADVGGKLDTRSFTGVVTDALADALV